MNGKMLSLLRKPLSKNEGNHEINSLYSKITELTLFFCVLFVSSLSFGQGPAGISADLRLWLDASDLDGNGTVDGVSEGGLFGVPDSVTTWVDKSAEGADFILESGADNPVYLADGGALFNNKAVVDFGINDILSHDLGAGGGVGAGDWDDDHTMFIVFNQQLASAPASTSIFANGFGNINTNGIDDHFQVGIGDAGTDFTYHTTNGGNSPTTTESSFSSQVSTFGALTLYSATRAGNTVTCYANGVETSTMAGLGSGEKFREYVLNADRSTTFINDCQIAEVIIYDVVLTPEEMTRIHNYLSCKYNGSFATVTPGGVDPCGVSLWLKADLGTDATSQSDPVSSWTDYGYYDFDGSAAGSEEPSFNTMNNNFNPSMTFDPITFDAISLGTSSSGDGMTMASSDFSIYTVASANVASNGVLFADNLCMQDKGYNLRYNSATTNWRFVGGAASGGAYTDSAWVEVNNSATTFSLLKMNRTGGDYTAENNVGGTSLGSSANTINFTATGTTERWIGKAAACGSTNFDGSLSEIILIKGAVSATQDIKIQSYLAVKYGLSLESALVNYLTSDGTVIWDNTILSYWNDVAGIGQDDGSLLDQRISKSQDPSGIVTISSTNDFTTANSDPARTSLADGNFLMWGNNNVSASGAWDTGSAPTDFAVIPEIWLVEKTGTVNGVSVRVDVNDFDNNIPTFFGDLYFVHGPNITAATPVLMTETSPGSGIWTISGINFLDDDFFTFAVENRVDIEFSLSTAFSTNESTADGFPTVLATGTLNVATDFIVINSGGGSATGGGVDYTYSNETISVSVGTYAITPFPLTAPGLINDLDLEVNEDILFAFNVAASDGIYVADADGSTTITSTHTYTITDDDSYNISIVRVTDGLENSSDVTFSVFIEQGVNISVTNITGNIGWTGDADAGDFTSVGNFTITPGNISTTINLGTSTLDDNLLEGTETIIGTISGLSAGSVTFSAIDTAYLDDDEMTDILVSIDTLSSSGTALEGATITYVIALESGTINNSGSTIDGSITTSGTTVPSDYTGPTTFSIPIGNNFTQVIFTANTDVEVELTETLIADIALTNGIGMVTTGGTATGYIIDEDTTGLTISLSVLGGGTGVTEGVGVTISYNVTLDNGKTNGTGSAISGPVTFSGTAMLGVDYSVPFPNFAIPDGQGTGVFTINIENDMIVEVTDNLTATITTATFGVPNAVNNNVVQSIFDDDSGLTQIAIGSPTNDTESPTGVVTFTVSIVAGGVSASPITGDISYASSTASSVTDFIPDLDFEIPAGATSTLISLPLIDDTNTEPTESVVATLIGVPSIGTYGNTISTAMITDDDASSLTMSIDTIMSGAEGGSNVFFVVSLDNGSTNGTGTDIYGNIVFTGSAQSTIDFSGAPVNFNIGNGESQDTIELIVINDIAVEYTDSIIATISNPFLGSVSLNDNATAYIIDNDLDSLSISIKSPVNGHEDGTPVSFTIAIDDGLENGLGEDLTGTVSYSGTSSAGLDFTDITSFAIPNGASFVNFELMVVNDQILEITETLIATLSAPLIPGSINPASASDTAEIGDNDLGIAELAIVTTTQGLESPPGGEVNPRFTVNIVGGLINETGSAITGTLDLVGTAMENVDYVGETSFSIPNDSSYVIIELDIIDDFIDEPTETIIATISAASQGLTISAGNSSATAEIIDDDIDYDNDGLPDYLDPNDVNIDSDCDGIFDGCDADVDGDGILDFGLVDTDGDGIHDGCDADISGNGVIDNGPDINGDGLNDVSWDPTDDDGDLLPNHVDPDDTNPDTDGDGIPDGADADVNGDGVLDNGCDVDGDGIHDVADSDDNPSDNLTDVGNLDDDLDGIDNDWDPFPNDAGGQAINYIVSPNGDDVNETLRIPGINFFENHKLMIFDRWGSPVYLTNEYNNEWSGQVNQGISITGFEILPDGVYYYVLDLGNGKDAVKGFIELRR